MNNKIMAVALIVSDLEKSIDFYQNKLELKIKTKEDSFADFETNGTTLALLEEKTAQDLAGDKVASNASMARPLILAWDAVENVDEVYKEMTGKGVPFSAEPKTMDWGQRVAYFSDHDNNLWEISQWVNEQ
jgi:catechol 2,3-dioxygenase-like lactoylglutathione lyase family enzyme